MGRQGLHRESLRRRYGRRAQEENLRSDECAPQAPEVAEFESGRKARSRFVPPLVGDSQTRHQDFDDGVPLCVLCSPLCFYSSFKATNYVRNHSFSLESVFLVETRGAVRVYEAVIHSLFG